MNTDGRVIWGYQALISCLMLNEASPKTPPKLPRFRRSGFSRDSHRPCTPMGGGRGFGFLGLYIAK
jgi:hypothetical protein